MFWGRSPKGHTTLQRRCFLEANHKTQNELVGNKLKGKQNKIAPTGTKLSEHEGSVISLSKFV